MNILIIAADFPPWDGGISQVAYEYARTFAMLNHNVTVLAPWYEDIGDWDAGQPFSVYRYRPHKAFEIQYLLLRWKLARLTRRHPFDWILSMRWNLDGVAMLPALKPETIFFQWYHGGELFDRHLTKPKWAARLSALMDRASINTAVSHFTSGLVTANFPACPRLQTVHLGVDTKRFVPTGDTENVKASLGLQGKKIFLTLARLVHRKGQALVIRSLAELKNKEIVYVICGKGKAEKDLRQLAEELDVADQVRFAGFINEEQKVQYYQACDLFVMPSKSEGEVGEVEGFGLTYLEANACGKPVIGGNQGGCLEAIAEGESGLLVDPDSPGQLTAAIRKLLDNPDIYHEMAIKARKRVEDAFSWEVSCRKLLELYKNSLDHLN